jgi:hypothetical protein
MYGAIACEALKANRCLELRYNGFSRIVEVHAVGISSFLSMVHIAAARYWLKFVHAA